MKKAAAMRPPLWVIYCNRFYMGASPGIPPAPPWCGGNTVSAGRGDLANVEMLAELLRGFHARYRNPHISLQQIAAANDQGE